MLIAVLTLLGGLVGLVAAGAAIVSGASTIGLRAGLPPLVVGLTIVAAGTSAPELAVVWRAADQGDVGLALGSVVGSNIANILLVVGLVATIGSIRVSRKTRRIDLPFMVLASAVTFGLAFDGAITSRDGIILVAGLVLYMSWTVWSSRSELATEAGAADPSDDDAPAPSASSEVVAPTVADAKPTNKQALIAVGAFAIGAVGVAVAAQFVVSGAEEIALSIGIPELVVGLTVLAVGTSMPEIITSVIAALRGDRDVALGNAIGSNVFNLLFVLGIVSVTHSDLPIADELLGLDFPVLLAVAALCIPFAITGAAISRWEGFALVGLYIGYTAYLVLDGLDNGAAPLVGTIVLASLVPIVGAAFVDFRRNRDVTET